jgi:hypothetical protein
MKIIRVFPRKTKATPDDENVRINAIPTLFDTADEVHISVAFTYDIPQAEYLFNQWKYVTNCKLGGPAFKEKGGDFIPGMYMKKGYVITSRGCNNSCWFCNVPQREGNTIRELPVTDGWIVTDDKCMRADIKALLECEVIYMPPDWENSRGARLEYEIACSCGIAMLDCEYCCHCFLTDGFHCKKKMNPIEGFWFCGKFKL